MFNETWLCRYPRPRKVVFNNNYKFKWYFTPLLKEFYKNQICTSIKNPRSNAPVGSIHQEIYKMFVTKENDVKVYDHIDPWGETLLSFAW